MVRPVITAAGWPDPRSLQRARPSGVPARPGRLPPPPRTGMDPAQPAARPASYSSTRSTCPRREGDPVPTPGAGRLNFNSGSWPSCVGDRLLQAIEEKRAGAPQLLLRRPGLGRRGDARFDAGCGRGQPLVLDYLPDPWNDLATRLRKSFQFIQASWHHPLSVSREHISRSPSRAVVSSTWRWMSIRKLSKAGP